MFRPVLIALIFILSACIPNISAQSDSEEDTLDTKVPVGMELKQLGNKPSVMAVLPKDSTMRRQGDLRIMEGTSEYASRKFTYYDSLLEKMSAEIGALRSDLESVKKDIAELKKKKLAS